MRNPGVNESHPNLERYGEGPEENRSEVNPTLLLCPKFIPS